MATRTKRFFEFEPFCLDAEKQVLFNKNGKQIRLPPKALALLLVLIKNRRRFLANDELTRLVWLGNKVVEGNLTQTIYLLRKALRDHPIKHKYIVNVPGQGYRFVADVKESNDTNRIRAFQTSKWHNTSYNPLAPSQLRAPIPDFVGRGEETKKLIATLQCDHAICISNISGMGGIGKTEFAVLVANHVRTDYQDGQLFIDLRGTHPIVKKPSDALEECIRAIAGSSLALPEDLDELVKLYRSVLSNKRVLILLDNAADSSQVRPLLPPPGSALLVTSRNLLVLPGLTCLRLEQLRPPEAREMLLAMVPNISFQIADEIALSCSYLPLAIRAAGSLLATTIDLDPGAYARQLEDESTRLARIGSAGTEIGVAASFNLSYSNLEVESSRVFRQLGTFHASFNAAAEEFICEDKEHLQLTDLVRRSLVLFDRETGRYRMHDLMRLFAVDKLRDEERYFAAKRHASYYLDILREADTLYKEGEAAMHEGLALFDLEWNNIQAGQTWSTTFAKSDKEAAIYCRDYPILGVDPLYLRQNPRARLSWQQDALMAARRLKDRSAEAKHLGNIGVSYTEIGEHLRAIEFHQKQLRLSRTIGYLRGEGNALGNTGLAWAALGKLRPAIKITEEALAFFRKTEDRRGQANALGNLGKFHADLGQSKLAIRFYEKALVIAKEIGDRRSKAEALINLAATHARLGKIDIAIELYAQGLAEAREIGDKRGEALALSSLANALNGTDRCSEAIAHLEAALKIFEQLEDPSSSRVSQQLQIWRERALRKAKS